MAIRKTPAKKPAAKKATTTRKSVTKKAPVKAAVKKAAPKRTAAKRSAASKPKSNKLHHRMHHHIKKNVLRYIGGATALFVLAFAAQTGLTYAATKKEAKKPTKGYMVIYSEKGKFTSVNIVPYGKLTCKGTQVKNGYEGQVSLKKGGKKVTCDATGGTQKYKISYFSDSTKTPVGNDIYVDVDAGYCVLVHNNAAKVRKVAAKGSKCENDSKNDTITPVATTMTAKLDDPKAKKKKLVAWADIQGKGINKKMCSGQARIELKNSSNQVVSVKNAPLKYTKSDGPARCVAKANMSKTEYGQSYTVQTTFGGNPYLNGSMNSSRVVTIPAKK